LVMTNQHPITPPTELVEQWVTEVWHEGTPARLSLSDMHITTEAARWGADQELEACCAWLAQSTSEPYINALRIARRPKPPSLKKQALEQLRRVNAVLQFQATGGETSVIRRALEALDD
jgi:hypothetical protein